MNSVLRAWGFFAFLFLIFLAIAPEIVSAQGIVGVSPGRHVFEGVLRGGFAERPFILSFSSDDPVSVEATPFGDIADWIIIEENTSQISRENPWTMLATVQPPSDTPNGNYSGFIRVQTSAIDSGGSEGHATGNIIAVLDVEIVVEVVDIEVIQCEARDFSVESAERGDDVVFDVSILNTGNVRLRPKISIDIWDQDQLSIVEQFEFIGQELLPTREEEVAFKMDSSDFDTDQYWVDVHAVDCFASDTLTFDVFEPGTLKAQGVLKEIIAPIWADVGETVSIFAIFENTGEKGVDARFKGQVSLEDKIVQVFESEITRVSVEELANFTMFFTPEDAGRYIVSGRVFYDKKRTFESSKVINVRGTGITLRSVGVLLLYAGLVAFILFLFFRIRKERRRLAGKI